MRRDVAVEQRAHVEPARTTRRELRREIRERQPGVDDVLDDHDIAPADVDLHVLGDAHAPRIGREARDRDEVDLDRHVGDRAREIGEEQQRALEHADEHDTVGMIGRDLPADALQHRAQLLARRAGSGSDTV